MGLPPAQGLYDPRFEHDACGLGFVATLEREPPRTTWSRRRSRSWSNLTHRGAAGCDPCTGDGAGILLQIPHALYVGGRRRARLRAAASRATTRSPCASSRRSRRGAAARRRILEAAVDASRPAAARLARRARRRGRHRPGRARVDAGHAPALHRARAPTSTPFERTLFMIRKRAGRRARELGGDDFYVASCSSRTVVYKGLMLPEQLAAFYPDLGDPRCSSQLAIVHSRFSTNTFPTWERAHPFRLHRAQRRDQHALAATAHWMRAREALLKSDVFGAAIEDFKPIIRPGGSDSASLDNVVDFLVASGRSLPHVMMMLIPEGVRQRPRHERRGEGVLRVPRLPRRAVGRAGRGRLHRRRASSAPCSIATASGPPSTSSPPTGSSCWRASSACSTRPGARGAEGARPAGQDVPRRHRRAGALISDDEIKQQVATRQAVSRVARGEPARPRRCCPRRRARTALSPDGAARGCSSAFGYTEEDLKMILGPMARRRRRADRLDGRRHPAGGALGAAAAPLPLLQAAVRAGDEPADRSDPRRDRHVAGRAASAARATCSKRRPSSAACSSCRTRSCRTTTWRKLRRNVARRLPRLHPAHDAFPSPSAPAESAPGGRCARRSIGCARRPSRASTAAPASSSSATAASATEQAPIPSLLATAAVHHHLIRSGQRVRARPGRRDRRAARGLAHVPAHRLRRRRGQPVPRARHRRPRWRARGDRLAKARAELRQGAQEGPAEDHVEDGHQRGLELPGRADLRGDRHRSDGHRQLLHGHLVAHRAASGSREIADEALARHAARVRPERGGPSASSTSAAITHWRATGEAHLWTPKTVAALQKAVRLDDAKSYDEYARLINDQTRRAR